MNTPTELDEIDRLIQQRINVEESRTWHGSLPAITSRGRQLRRRRTTRLCGVAAATVGLVATGLFLNSPWHNPSEQTLATEPQSVPIADYGWSTNRLALEDVEAAQIAEACRVIGTLQDGPVQALSRREPVAISQQQEAATALYLGANNLGICEPEWIQGRWRGQADGSFIVRPIERPSKISPATPVTIEFASWKFTSSADGSPTLLDSMSFGWAGPEVNRIQVSVADQRHEALVQDGYYFVEFPAALDEHDAVERTADGRLAEFPNATLTAYDASGAEIATIPYQAS